MAKTAIAQLKNWFKNGLKPTEAHFWNWLDSFWHKDEAIPIENVDGLEDELLGKASALHSHSEYAARDGGNLDEGDIAIWQEKLQIGGSDDVDVKLTKKHEYFGLEAGDSQKDYNAKNVEFIKGAFEAISGKIDKPTDVDTSENFPFVVLLDEDGNPAKTPAGDLGKNIGNSDLTISEPRVLDTDGKPFSITNLPDKSADATFIDFIGKSRSGQMAQIGFQAFKNQAESWTEAQKSEYGQILNGGFSVGSMSVNLISPPVFEREDNDVYVVLRGANLNLHPTQRKIELLDAVTENVLAEIPVSQIQTYASGTQLVFYYNFNIIGVGVYKLRITSGVNVFVTTQNFQVVGSVTNIDLSTNTFDILTSYSNTLSFATNDTVVFENEIEGADGTVPIFSAKSSELFSQGEDFFLEVLVDNNNDITGAANTRVSVGYSNNINQLVYVGLSYFGIYYGYANNRRKFVRVNTGVKNIGIANTPVVGSIIFTKQGNLLTTIFDDLVHSETISNNSGYSLFFQAPNRVNKETTSIQILKAYKF